MRIGTRTSDLHQLRMAPRQPRPGIQKTTAHRFPAPASAAENVGVRASVPPPANPDPGSCAADGRIGPAVVSLTPFVVCLCFLGHTTNSGVRLSGVFFPMEGRWRPHAGFTPGALGPATNPSGRSWRRATRRTGKGERMAPGFSTPPRLPLLHFLCYCWASEVTAA